MKKTIQEQLMSFIKENKNFQVVEELTNGYVFSYTVSIPFISKEGNREFKKVNKYNYISKDGSFPYINGFDCYRICENGDCIFGIEKTVEDYEKTIDFYSEFRTIDKESCKYLYGVINKEGTYMVPPIYDFLEYANEDAVIATHDIGYSLYPKEGYISTVTGRQLTPIKFHKAYPFSEGLGRVIIDQCSELTGFVDRAKTIKNINNPEEYAFPPFRGNATDYQNGQCSIFTASRLLARGEEIIIDRQGNHINQAPRRVKA